MEVFETADFKISEKTSVTIGNFDGIHLGHQRLVNTVNYYADNFDLKSVVFSFNPHPVVAFGKSEDFKTMLSVNEKKFVLSGMNVDILIQYPFDNEFSSLTPEEFIDLLCAKTNCSVIVVGENYYFGKDKSGNIDTLKDIAVKRNIEVVAIPRVKVDNVRVSSTRIRESIKKGEMEIVTKLLNKPYFVIGEVVNGFKRGRTINYPTINLDFSKTKLLPPDGVYFSSVLIDGKRFFGMSNIGVNPTFDTNVRKIETHIFDFNKNIYGEKVVVNFYKLIRLEKKFSSIDKLKEQLDKDKMLCLDLINKGVDIV